MGFLQKARTVILGHMNDLVDKVVDMNSIPVLKQYVRDLEDAIESAQHQAAVANAQATTLGRDKKNAEDQLAADERRASAYISSNNETAARQVAGRIHDTDVNIGNLATQIKAAQEQSHELDGVVEKLRTKHDAILARVRELEVKDRGAKALEQATASMKSAGAILNSGVDSGVDNLAHRIEERSDVAREEFRRSVGDLDQPEDPVKTAEVDNILDNLKRKMAVPASA